MNDVLLAGLWQGALVAAIAASAARLVPERNAATRYSIWFSALVALAVLPLVTLWHPMSLAALAPAVSGTVIATTAVTGQAAALGGSMLLLVWLAGVAFCAVRLALSYARIREIVRRAAPAPHLGARVLLSDELEIPIAAGFFRGAVVIPLHLARTLEADELAGIIAHEHAHILRRDVAANFLQRCIEALLFFNPWVYVIGRSLVREREAACDDYAVHAGAAAERYASCLARLARSARAQHAPLLTPSAIGGRRMLVGRVARLLNGKATQLKVNYLALTGTIATFALLAVVLQASNGLALASPAPPQAATIDSHLSSNCRHDAKIVNAAPPDIAKADYRSGASADALVTVSPAGDVEAVKIVKSSGSAAIDRATIDAAKHSTYQAAEDACKPATGEYLFKVRTGPA